MAVANVALAITWHAVAGTPFTVHAAFAGALAGTAPSEHQPPHDDRTVCHALSRPMTILTHAVFAIMLLLALLAGFWGHQRLPE